MRSSILLQLSLIALFFFGFKPQNLSATHIQGRVVEKMSDAPLAYVNIGIVGKGVGTVTNTKGEFSLKIPDGLATETMRVSMIGYKAKEFTVADFIEKVRSDYNIFLEPTSTEIEEISIVDSKMKSYLKGNKTKSQFFSLGFESDTLGNEFATKFRIRKRPTLLKDFRISINENTFDTLRFRLNIYSIKNGQPGEIINTKNVIISTTKKDAEVLIVDLLPYNIRVEKSFFASLEWIDSSESATVAFSAAYPARTVYYRSTSHAKWKKVNGLGIGMQMTILQ